MALREDNALQFEPDMGFGINSTTGALEPVADGGAAIGSAGAAAAAKRVSNVLAEMLTVQSDFGIKQEVKWVEEEITLATGASTTDSTSNLLPADSIILFVVGEVTATITTATGWSLGDGTVAARFRANDTTLAAGTLGVGAAHWHGAVNATNAGPTQASAAKLRVTCAGGNPGAGKIKVTVFYLTASKAA